MNMKDRIKFNDAMLSAVMEGRKTQTRRPIDPQPKLNEERLKKMGAIAEGFTLGQVVNSAWQAGFIDVDCPYGEVGDIINIADKDGNIKGKIEITDVWIQQVQEVSQEDAHAEGFDGKLNAHTSDFAAVWIAIYGISSWRNNEWSWVIEFKKVE